MNHLMLFAESDDPTSMIIKVGAVVLLVTVISILSRRYERSRAKSFAKITEDLGLKFSQKDEEGHGERLQRFQIGNVGQHRRVKNIANGTWSGEDIMFCDYRFSSYSDGKVHKRSQSLVILTINDGCPDLSMVPKGVFHKVLSMVPEGVLSKVWPGLPRAHINFLTHPEFTKRFILRGNNEDAIREHFTFALLEFFEGRPGASFEVCSGEFVFSSYKHRYKRRCKPKELEAFFREALEVKAALEGKPRS